MGRRIGSKNKNPKPQSKEARRKEHQRRMEVAVKLDEFLTAEAKQAIAANPGKSALLYQGTQAKILGRQFVRVAKRLKGKRPE
jgi:hypothetical protein